MVSRLCRVVRCVISVLCVLGAGTTVLANQGGGYQGGGGTLSKVGSAGINFLGTGNQNGVPVTLVPDAIAGYVPQHFWNNAASVGGTMALDIDLDGDLISSNNFTVSWSSGYGVGNTPIANTGGNSRLMKGHLLTDNYNTITVTLSGIPHANLQGGYSLIVYLDGDNGSVSRVGKYTLSGPRAGTKTVYALDKADTNFSGAFRQVPVTSHSDEGTATVDGNMIIFTGLSDASLTLSVTGASTSDSSLSRATLAGIQLVDGFVGDSLCAIPATPGTVTPGSWATDVSLTPTLQAGPFLDADPGDTHAASQWVVLKQVVESPSFPVYTTVFDSGEDSKNKTSCPVPKLDYSTAYFWKVRYRDSSGVWSEYSALTRFTTIAEPNVPPATPTNLAPENARTFVSVTPTLEASAFSDPNKADTLEVTEWKVMRASDGYLVAHWPGNSAPSSKVEDWDGSPLLAYGTKYKWQVRYQDSKGAWSEFSTPTTFTTLPEPIPEPFSDDFASRGTLTGTSVVARGGNVSATRENDEPVHQAGSQRSMWCSWKAPYDGRVTISTSGSGFDTFLAVYKSNSLPADVSLSSLMLVASDDNSGARKTSQVTFQAVGGEVYQIAVDSGSNDANGFIQLTLKEAVSGVKGSYTGLIQGGDNTVDTTGFYTFVFSGNGTFTSTIMFAGDRYTLKGALDSTGSFSGVAKSGTKQLKVDFKLKPGTIGWVELKGTLSNDFFIPELSARQNVNAPPSGTDFAGKYTVMIVPPEEPDAIVQSYGYGSVTISAFGKTRFIGTLGDGTKVVQGGEMTGSEWPFYLQPYAKKDGLVIGRINFRDVPNVSDFDGTLLWFRPAGAKGAIYPVAVDGQAQSTVSIVGSRYQSVRGERVLNLAETTGNAQLQALGGHPGVPYNMSFPFTLSSTNKVTAIAGSNLNMKVDAATGMFSGSFQDGSVKRIFEGAIFQKQNIGVGLFKGNGIPGDVWLRATAQDY